MPPVFEADFQPGSFGYRPQRTAHEAVDRVARAIVQHKTRVIDIDLSSYFDNVRHDRLLAKVAERVDDGDVMHLLKVMLKANGKQGVHEHIGNRSNASPEKGLAFASKESMCVNVRRMRRLAIPSPRRSLSIRGSCQ